MQHVFLKKGRERPVLNGHPWIFSGAIERVEDGSDAAGVTDVLDSGGRWLARGLYNPCGAYRLVNGEGDFLPGLVVDRYGDFLVGQFFTAGMDSLRGTVVDALAALFPAMGIYERSEGGVREEEGLIPSVGVLRGEEPPDLLQIEEHQLKFLVDIRKGQKTGFFLDQRENRLFLSMLARDKAILNCFAYTGAFTAYALRGGARQVLSIESSRPALDLARQNLDLNGLSVSGGELVKADAFSYLKYCKDQFDIVVVDPPSLALKRADVQPAAGSYKFLNLHALRLLKPGGMLLTFCCSQHVSLDLFQKIIFGAAADSGRKVRLLNRLGHPVDHPVSLHHPEGEYLKGLLLSVLE
ncbi:MAG: class I SAM-dependent rRNA methyltransferase [Deltaproteobacteria bacterium]|nr:class I SAM-dependent rRNA methyltransferase [Deltaproteobacteria bacterium]